jgi:agmatine/peptidylarginine deiminase|tara:strand:- start:5140 stop:5550 length:411 start_codon:yes stop_codon:yes gene_type:complete
MRKRYQTKRTSKYRSGLEVQIAEQLISEHVDFEYESKVIKYTKPQKVHRYTPDFILEKKKGGIMHIEGKGRFLTADKQKTLLVKEQYPKLDLRFVFSNSKTKISKKSKTTYAMWCEKHGFKYADKFIPKEWLNEIK